MKQGTAIIIGAGPAGLTAAIELQRTPRTHARRVAPDADPQLDPRVRAVEVENQIYAIDQKFGQPIIRQPHRPQRRDIGRKVEHGRVCRNRVRGR